MYDVDDIVDMKNREKKKRRRTKMLGWCIVMVAAAILIATSDLWLPKLRGIGKQYKTVVNSGKLAEGNFPIEMSGTDYQLKYTVKKIMVLSENHLYIYDTDGNLLKKRQHAYSNPVLRVANGRAIVYESGGNRFTVENEDDVFFSKSYENNNILFARISSDGYAAVVTTSENFSCELNVYNKKGKVIYERKCTDMISDLSFINKSSGCVLSFIEAENGSLKTSVQEINFKESKEKWTSPLLGTLGLEIFGSSEGAFVYGMNGCGYVNKSGEISSYYQYDGTLAAGASMSGKSAIVYNNDETRKYTAVLFKNNSSEPLVIELPSHAVDVSVFQGLAYILCSDKLLAYDFSGTLRSTADVNDSYTGFVRSDDHIFLKGYNKIDRIDYET